jgi:hypothetical protein
VGGRGEDRSPPAVGSGIHPVLYRSSEGSNVAVSFRSVDEVTTFGTAVTAARKKLRLARQELVDLLNADSNGPVSFDVVQLNNLEHDRSDPRQHALVAKLARHLALRETELWSLAQRHEDSFRRRSEVRYETQEAMLAFRRTIR